MATLTWYLQGTSPTTIAATDIIQFAGATFNSAIFVGEYNDSTHVKTSGGTNKSSGNTPKNNKYIDATHVSIDGGASSLLSGISTANCALKLNFSHGSSVVVTDHILYAYDGVTTTSAPTGVVFKAAEQGDANWTEAGGSASALTITDNTTATSHDFFVAMSASPSSEGTKTAFKIRDEFIYS
jgi:hypothetical protein